MYREKVFSVAGAFSLSIAKAFKNFLDVSSILTNLTQIYQRKSISPVLAENSNSGGDYGRRA
jgi:hypothetical protein